MTLEGSTAPSNSIERFFLEHAAVLLSPAALGGTKAAKLAALMQFCKAKVVIVETLVLTDVVVDVKVTVGIKEFFS